MIRINRRTDYAVRVMLALARHAGEGRLSTQQIQDQMLVPRAFLQRIIADLSRQKLIKTYTGPNGGLELTRSVETFNLREIYEAIEGPLLISDCLEAAGVCPLDKGCPVRPRWACLQALMARELEAITLAELVADADKIGQFQTR